MSFPPQKLNENLSKAIDGVFHKWQVPLAPSQGPMPFTDDFGGEIKSLLIPPEYSHGNIHFIYTPRNLVDIAQNLGISIYRSDSFYYIRDHFLCIIDGSIATSKSSIKLEDAAIRTHSSNLYLHRSAATHTKNQLFNSWSGHTNFQGSIKNLPQGFPKPYSLQFAYVEGGNMFTLTNLEGVTKVLIGSDHFWHTFQILELETAHWEDLYANHPLNPNQTWQQSIAKISTELTPSQIQEYAEEMFASQLLSYKGKSGLIHPKVQLPLLMLKIFSPTPFPIGPNAKNWFRNLASDASSIPKFAVLEKDIESLRKIVAPYLAKKGLTHALIASDFKVPREDVHFIPQVNYHLDTFLTPGPGRSIFITDYAFTSELLEALKQSSDKLQISTDDLILLDRYIETAKKLHSEMSSLLQMASLELVKAGFKVIPAPTSIIYESSNGLKEFPLPVNPLSINFANALTGWSPKMNKHFYITHGMQSGDKLGTLIMAAIAEFLNNYSPGIEVYFIGKGETGEFKEAMSWWNQLETQSGVHCTTWKLE